MLFVHESYAAIFLVALTLVVQSAGMAALIEWARAHLPAGNRRFGLVRGSVLMMRLTSLIVCLHMLQILLWAWFYRWNCFATWESSFYFSASSYSTVGYGDLVLPHTWRMVGPIESVTGVLMCGLSASFLFAVVTRLVEHDDSQSDLRSADANLASTVAQTSSAGLTGEEVKKAALSGKPKG